MFYSKVVIICWAIIFVGSALTAVLKQRWSGLRHVLVGAAIVAAGILLSALLNNSIGALLLSAALLVSTYFTLVGIIRILSTES